MTKTKIDKNCLFQYMSFWALIPSYNFSVFSISDILTPKLLIAPLNLENSSSKSDLYRLTTPFFSASYSIQFYVPSHNSYHHLYAFSIVYYFMFSVDCQIFIAVGTSANFSMVVTFLHSIVVILRMLLQWLCTMYFTGLNSCYGIYGTGNLIEWIKVTGKWLPWDFWGWINRFK